MPNCEVCDQELVEGDFEEKLGICVSCIMIESREESFRSLFAIFMILLGWLMFISAFLSIILNIGFLFVDFEQHIFYIIQPLIWFGISGIGVIYFSFVYKFK